MRWISDRVAVEMMRDLGITLDQAERGLRDAEMVWNYIVAHEWIDEDELRTWAEGQDVDPDRMNIALGLLRLSKRAWPIDVPAPVAAMALPPGTRAESRPGGLWDYPKDSLLSMAESNNIKGASKMTKKELIAALEGSA